MNEQALVEQSTKLLQEGLTEDQIVALLRLRRRLEHDGREELTSEYKRLKFARWCVEHGLLHQ